MAEGLGQVVCAMLDGDALYLTHSISLGVLVHQYCRCLSFSDFEIVDPCAKAWIVAD